MEQPKSSYNQKQRLDTDKLKPNQKSLNSLFFEVANKHLNKTYDNIYEILESYKECLQCQENSQVNNNLAIWYVQNG